MSTESKPEEKGYSTRRVLDLTDIQVACTIYTLHKEGIIQIPQFKYTSDFKIQMDNKSVIATVEISNIEKA